MNELNLNQQYKKLIEKLNSFKTNQNGLEEVSITIHTSDWIKIYLIGSVDEIQIQIQVEVTYSPEIKSTSMTDHLRKILENHKLSLEYLLTLSNNGFSLGFIKKENFWFATRTLDSEPNEELSKLILPPQFHDK